MLVAGDRVDKMGSLYPCGADIIVDESDNKVIKENEQMISESVKENSEDK